MSLSALYAKLPPGMVRRVVREHYTHMNISTTNLRKLLKMKDLDRDIKGRLYSIALYRRHESRRRRHAA